MSKIERLKTIESVFFSMLLKEENMEDLQGLKTLQELNEINENINIRFLTESEYLSAD